MLFRLFDPDNGENYRRYTRLSFFEYLLTSTLIYNEHVHESIFTVSVVVIWGSCNSVQRRFFAIKLCWKILPQQEGEDAQILGNSSVKNVLFTFGPLEIEKINYQWKN